MRAFFYLLIPVFLTYCCFSQQKAIDSIWRIANTAVSDTQKINALNKLFFYFSSNNKDSAVGIAEEALELSNKKDYLPGKVSANNNLGTIYFYEGNNTKALTHFLTAIELLESVKDTPSQGTNHKKQISSAYNNLGTIYQRQKLFEKAEFYFRKAITIDLQIGDKEGMAHCYNNIGTIKEETNKYDEAIGNYELSLKLKKEVNDTDGIASTLINMGVIRMNQDRLQESKAYFGQALANAKRCNNKQDEALALVNMGDVYYSAKEYALSVIYYEKGIEICKDQNYQQFLSYALSSISLSFYKMKDYKQAYEAYHNHVAVKDSLYNGENARALHEIEAKYQTESKEKEIKLLMSEKELKDMELNKKKTVIYVTGASAIVLMFLVLLVLRAYSQKRVANKELDVKNQKIEFAYKIIEEKQKEIVDSINYAKRIQYALLAHNEILEKNLNEHFVLFKPKDIVSGDFYWATVREEKFYLAVCDSTGHGVPGAFMSLLSIGFLSEAINEKGIVKPNEVFSYVKKRLVENISKEGQKDGFDGILLCFDKRTNSITYAAAQNNPLFVTDNQLQHLETNKMPVGPGETIEEFKLFTIEKVQGSVLYLYTDGYADQFGGPKGKKFKRRALGETLFENRRLSLAQQGELLDQKFEDWKGNLEQVDDVCVIGIRL